MPRTVALNVVLPYFGETSKDNWLTYPMCQFAVSEHLKRTTPKREAVMDVLAAVFSQEGQSAMASGATVLSYNKESMWCLPSLCAMRRSALTATTCISVWRLRKPFPVSKRWFQDARR